MPPRLPEIAPRGADLPPDSRYPRGAIIVAPGGRDSVMKGLDPTDPYGLTGTHPTALPDGVTWYTDPQPARPAPMPNDFTAPAPVRPRGATPRLQDALDHEYADFAPPPTNADALDREWRAAYATLERTEHEWAELHPRFGPMGQWDAHRRAYRGVIATALREAARTATPPRKLTEAEVEDAACADDRYQAYLSEAETGAVRYALLTSERARAKETMEWARTRAYLLGAEARLSPGGVGA